MRHGDKDGLRVDGDVAARCVVDGRFVTPSSRRWRERREHATFY